MKLVKYQIISWKATMERYGSQYTEHLSEKIIDDVFDTHAIARIDNLTSIGRVITAVNRYVVDESEPMLTYKEVKQREN